MPTSGDVAGKLIRLQISTDSGTTYDTVGCTTEDGFSTSSNVDDEACKDSGGWSNPTVTTQNWEITASGFVIYDSSDLNFYDLLTLKTAATEVLIKWGTTVTGDDVITGTAIVTDISQTGSVDGKATYDITLMGKGVFSTATNA